MTIRALLASLACALMAACTAPVEPPRHPLLVMSSLNLVELDPTDGSPTPAPLTFGFLNGPNGRAVRIDQLALDYIGPNSDDPLPSLSVAPTSLPAPVDVPAGGNATTDVQIVTPSVLGYFQAHPDVGSLRVRVIFSGTTDAAQSVEYRTGVPISRRSTPTP